MASKKTGKETSIVAPEKKCVYFTPMTYLIEDTETILGLMMSPEPVIKLRALVTLHKYTRDENCFERLISKGMYYHLCNNLNNKEPIILRYSLKILSEIITNERYLDNIKFEDLFTCFDPVVALYLQMEDPFILEATSLIMLHLVKYNDIFTVRLYSKQLIARLFNKIKTTRDIDVHRNSFELLFCLLQTKLAEDELPTTSIISVNVLLCLLKSEIANYKDLAMDTLITLVLWRNDIIMKRFSEKKVVDTMIDIIMTNNAELFSKAFDIVKVFLEVEKYAIQFSKSYKFIEFSVWARHCPPHAVKTVAEILTMLTKIPKVRQTLFNLSIEDTIMSLFRYKDESIWILACEAISNMSTHSYCQKIVTPSLILTLLTTLKTPNISATCLEMIIKIILNFLKRNVNTLRILVKLNGIYLICWCIFEKRKECTEEILEIIEFCSNSKYAEEIINLRIFEKLMAMFLSGRYVSQILSIFNNLVYDPEFRHYFVEMEGPKLLLNEIRMCKCTDLLTQMLILIQNLLPYKNVELIFLDECILSVMNNLDSEIRRKIKVIDNIIDIIFDSLLTLKFFKRGRLEISDVIRDTFCLIHNNWFTENSNSSITCKPIYVVNYPAVQSVYKSISKFRPSVTFLEKHNEKDMELTCAAVHLKQLRNINCLSGDCAVSTIKEPIINYGNISDDPYLVDYMAETYYRLNKRKPIKSIQARVKYLAKYVDKQLSGFEDTTDVMRQKHFYNLHLMHLQETLGTNLIPIGFLRMGYHCERALLFKVLADNLDLSVTLSKGINDVYWNEVAVIPKIVDQTNHIIYYVIDLIYNIGNLMQVGSYEANKYCHVEMVNELTPAEQYGHTK